MQARRKQNSSCDRCRRAKSGCDVRYVGGKSPAEACSNCRRLNIPCTVTWIAGWRGKNSGHDDISVPASARTQRHITSSANSTEACRRFEHEPNLDLCGMMVSPSSRRPQTLVNTDSALVPGLSPTLAGSVQHIFQNDDISRSLQRHTVQGLLSRIYRTISASSEVGILSHRCNPFAGPDIYTFRGHKSTGSQEIELLQESEQTLEVLQAPRSSNTSIEPVQSLLNLVLMVDNPANKCSRHLTTQEFAKVSEVVHEVVKAFASQWLSSGCDPRPKTEQSVFDIVSDIANDSTIHPGRTLHRESWLEAHRALLSILSIHSFCTIYSLFLFSLIARPTGEDFEGLGNSDPDTFLDIGLRNMQVLGRKTGCECQDATNPGSPTRTAWTVLKWFGFVLDTSHSIWQDRPIILFDHLDPAVDGYFADARPDTDSDYNGVVFVTAKQAIKHGMNVWRSIIATINSGPSCEFSTPMTTTMEMVDQYTEVYGNFMSRCLQNFHTLSGEVQVFFTSLVYNWGTGLIVFCDYADRAKIRTSPLCSLTLKAKISNYRDCAARLIFQISAAAMRNPTNLVIENPRVASDMRMSFSRLVSTGLTIKALVKTAEYVTRLPDYYAPPFVDIGLGTCVRREQCLSTIRSTLRKIAETVWGYYRIRDIAMARKETWEDSDKEHELLLPGFTTSQELSFTSYLDGANDLNFEDIGNTGHLDGNLSMGSDQDEFQREVTGWPHIDGFTIAP